MITEAAAGAVAGRRHWGLGDRAMLGVLGAKTWLSRVGYGASCVLASLVLFAAGVGYYAQKQVNGIGMSNVLAGGPSTGAMNILIMGLESRTYWNGTPIDHHLQHMLNLGSAGGEATNTLILLHVFDDGQQAVAFSIPRDDYVQMYGTMGYGPAESKIDAAYAYAMSQEMTNDRASHPSWTSAQVNFDGNEAGRLAEVETVEALTGVHIDKFAELNLIGFYELSSEFGGVEVCVNKWPGGDGYQEGANLTDPVQYNSAEGQDAGSGSVVVPGLQHLSPMQTLEFVRARHNLPQGDIDRTYRQQAVLDYVLWKLKTEGALADVGKLGPLLTVAKEYLAVPKGWNLLQFAGELDSLTPQTLTFHTLPSTQGPDVPGVGDVNDVNVVQIQAQVQQAFSAPPGDGTAPATASPASTSKSGTASGGSAKKAPALPAGLGGRQAGAATPTPAPSISYAADGSVSAASATLAKKAIAEYGIPCVY
ncbi:MAG TPA: LCP family protein [Trebonia sp.]